MRCREHKAVLLEPVSKNENPLIDPADAEYALDTIFFPSLQGNFKALKEVSSELSETNSQLFSFFRLTAQLAEQGNSQYSADSLNRSTYFITVLTYLYAFQSRNTVPYVSLDTIRNLYVSAFDQEDIALGRFQMGEEAADYLTGLQQLDPNELVPIVEREKIHKLVFPTKSRKREAAHARTDKRHQKSFATREPGFTPFIITCRKNYPKAPVVMNGLIDADFLLSTQRTIDSFREHWRNAASLYTEI